MRRIRIIVAGIFVFGTLLGGISLYVFLHTEAEPINIGNQIRRITGEEELGIPGEKKVIKDHWSVINNCLNIYSETQFKKAEALKIPATYEEEKVHSIDITCPEGSIFLRHVEIEEGVEEIEYGFVVDYPNLETAVIPKSIKKMDKSEFKDCKKKVTLYVVKNSYAEKWAKKHNVRYKYGRPKGVQYIDYKELV